MDLDKTRQQECKRKQRYPTEAEAREVAEHQMQSGSPPLTVYECIWCRGWHLAKRD